MSKSSDDGSGCAIIIAIVAFSLGIGSFWGMGAGWMTLGMCFLALVVVAA